MSKVEIAQEKVGKKIKTVLIPLPLKILLFVLSFILLIAVGLMIGFGILGDGEATQVFDESTWLHIVSYFRGG